MRRAGLEAGSKAELLAILPIPRPGVPILCNGFKDVAYIEMALRAQRLGLNVHIIIEKPTEFQLAIDVGHRLGVEPKLGVRVKLAARGSGHWEATGGNKIQIRLECDRVVVRYPEAARLWNGAMCTIAPFSSWESDHRCSPFESGCHRGNANLCGSQNEWAAAQYD